MSEFLPLVVWLMTLLADDGVLPALPKRPPAIELALCSSERSFTVHGKRTIVAAELSMSDSLAMAARAAHDAGFREVTVRSACKLTTKGLAMYCEAFEREQVHLASIIVPVGNPTARKRFVCDDEMSF